jgi:hypothetical protein
MGFFSHISCLRACDISIRLRPSGRATEASNGLIIFETCGEPHLKDGQRVYGLKYLPNAALFK